MLLEHQIVSIVGAAIVYTAIAFTMAVRNKKSRTDRQRTLWKLFFVSGFVFLLTLVPIAWFLPLTTLNLLSWLVYATVLAFVVTIEIPGYIKLAKLDETYASSLEEIRSKLLSTKYDFKNFEPLKESFDRQTRLLPDETVTLHLKEFVDFTQRIKNIDDNLWALTIAEVTTAIDTISNRSKHPIPKVIDIVSLAGISFLLAQFLNLLP
jgi:hypothetical protein